MINGKDILQLGYPKGPIVGKVLAVAFRLLGEHPDYATDPEDAVNDVKNELGKMLSDPLAYAAGADDHVELANLLIAHQKRVQAAQAVKLRESAAPFAVYGRELIAENAVQQMENAMRLPVSVAAALMPDAHLGYGIPIGGVLAMQGVSPYSVGVDIACRMQITVFDAAYDAVPVADLVKALHRHTRFGTGVGFEAGDQNAHPVLDDPLWDEHPFLRKNGRLRSTAAAQLGSSGTGNHFVEFGVLADADGGQYLALMTHSGSRALGANIANHYSAVAMKLRKGLDASVKHLAWLDLESQEGQEYWSAMNLAGEYAHANHQAIHARLQKHLGLEVRWGVSHHHNFAWRETIITPDGEQVEAIVHRKGATPAQEGALGVIPGSMATPAYVVRGKGNPASLNSASHGSGRLMSRSAAFKALAGRDLRAELAVRGITLVGGALDEAPDAYKPVAEVIRHQQDLVEIVAEFNPKVVRMAD